jgi:hypothetical protein
MDVYPGRRSKSGLPGRHEPFRWEGVVLRAASYQIIHGESSWSLALGLGVRDGPPAPEQRRLDQILIQEKHQV